MSQYRRNQQQQNNHYQQQNRSQQHDPNRSEKQQLERELRQLQHQLTTLDGQIDGLFFQGRQLEADLRQHQHAIPAAVATEILRAATNAIGLPFLPPAYRNWNYKRERLLQMESNLRYRAIALKTQRDALVQQIEKIQIDIDLLRYQP